MKKYLEYNIHVANAFTIADNGSPLDLELCTGQEYSNMGFFIHGETGRIIFYRSIHRVTLIDPGDVKIPINQNLLTRKPIELGIPATPDYRLSFIGPNHKEIIIKGIK